MQPLTRSRNRSRFPPGPFNLLSQASLRLRFSRGEIDPRVLCGRTTTGTFFDGSGVLQTAAIGVPRITYDPADLSLPPGLLAEEARTNSIRNSTMQGAVAGTPGTLPTNWSVNAVSGLAWSVAGLGVEGGLPFVDIRFTGTATGTSSSSIQFETNTGVSAANSQTWTVSNFVKVQSGSLTGISATRLGWEERSGAFLDTRQGTVSIASPVDLRAARLTFVATNENASTTFIKPYLGLTPVNGATIDITLRIGLPQLELGASASSPIPTSGAAATRAADNLSMTDMSWYQQSGGVLYIDFDMPNYLLGFFRYVLAISSNSTINAVSCVISANSQNAGLRVVTPSGVQAVLQNAKNLGQRTKFAARFQVNDAAVSFDGGPLLKDATVELPTGVTLLGIGNILGSGGYGGIIREIAFIPNTNISDSALQQLTRP
jgi:hypothetical protein